MLKLFVFCTLSIFSCVLADGDDTTLDVPKLFRDFEIVPDVISLAPTKLLKVSHY